MSRSAAPSGRPNQLVLCLLMSLLLVQLPLAQSAAAATDLIGRFDQANKLYEQAKYQEAAAAYQTLLQEHPSSPTLLFNLGNASFKSGNLGRAIAAYRLAQRALPRDPALRFNLAFARKQLVGLPPPPQAPWERAVAFLTQDEWTGLTAGFYWLWMCLLIARELFPPARRALRSYSIAAGFLIIVPLSGLLLSLYQRHNTHEAVIIVSNAAVRYGPLTESQTYFQLRDGAEVQILDRKQLQTETWFRIQDSTGRTGWVAELDLLRLPAEK